MSFPQIGQAKVDKILSSFSQRYSNDEYISTQILPIVKVKEKTGKFAKYGKDNLRVFSGGLMRGVGDRAKGVDYTVSQGTYSCFERAAEKQVPYELADNTDDPYDPKRDAVRHVMDLIFQDNEYALAQVLGNTSIMTQNVTLSGTSKWSDYTNSDPIGDIKTAVLTVHQNTGKWPNLVVLSKNVFMTLKFHPAIRQFIQYTLGGQVTDDAFLAALANLFNVKQVIVGYAVYNSAVEGQTDVMSDIWSGNAYVLYRAPVPTLMDATLGFTLTDIPRVVDGWPEPWTNSEYVRCRWSYDQNIMDAQLGYLIKGAV